MRILHIVGSMDPATGGICQAIRNNIPELIKSGSTCEVASMDAPESSFLGVDGFFIHALGPAKGPWQYAPKLQPWLMSNASRFDVIVVNGIWIYSSYASWRVLKFLKKKAGPDKKIPKLYVMPHGMLDPYFQQAATRRLKAIRNWIYWKLIEKRVINDADGVLFTCETELQLARKTFPSYQPKNELNVGFGIIPPPPLLPAMYQSFLAKCPEAGGRPYLLFLGRIDQKKGVDLLISSYAMLLAQLKATQNKIPHLIIAGPGIETSFGKQIKDLAKTLKIDDLVFFSGMLSGEAKWGAFYNCEAFILPSHQENFGIAVVEAMACSRAVLISDKVNIWMEIEAGGGGIVGNDTAAGVNALLLNWMQLSKPEQTLMGENASLVFKSHFDVKASVANFLKSTS